MVQPKWLLQAEGAAIFVASLVVYGARGYGWWIFLALFLLPDVSMLGYLHNVRTGASFYNAAHTELVPVLLALAVLQYRPRLLAYSLIWLAHIGFDRMLGFGLKYPTRFADTHLGRV